ncbi:MAG: metallophosphoesterase family protein [Rhodothermales bacterium]
MILGILSDTHGYFHPSLPEFLADVDLILHAGDVGGVEVLDRLEALAPVQLVYGNVDGREIRLRGQELLRTEVDGLRLWMTHIGGTPGRWNRSVAEALRADPPDIFVCGHSHILRVERVTDMGNMLYINPGAAGRQGFHQVKTCLRLDVRDGAARQVEVVHLDE